MRTRSTLIFALLVTTLMLLPAATGEAIINVGNTIQTGMVTLQAGQILHTDVHHRAGQGARCVIRIVYRNEVGTELGSGQLQVQGGDAGFFEFDAGLTPQRVRAELTLVPIPQPNGNCIVSAEVRSPAEEFLYRLGDAATFDIVP